MNGEKSVVGLFEQRISMLWVNVDIYIILNWYICIAWECFWKIKLEKKLFYLQNLIDKENIFFLNPIKQRNWEGKDQIY